MRRKELRNPTTMGFRNLTCIPFTLNSRKVLALLNYTMQCNIIKKGISWHVFLGKWRTVEFQFLTGYLLVLPLMSFVLELGELHLWRLQKCRAHWKAHDSSSWGVKPGIKSKPMLLLWGQTVIKIYGYWCQSVADCRSALEIRFPMFLPLLPTYSCCHITIPSRCLSFNIIIIVSSTHQKLVCV